MSKVNNHFILIIIVTSSLLLLMACGGNEQTAEELIRYHNEDWTELAEKRDKVLNGNTSQLRQIERTEGDQGSREFLEEVILSEFEDFIEEEKAMEMNDDSVKELHELLIEADEFFYNFLKEKGPAYYLGEIGENELLEANEEVKKSYEKFFNYRDKLMKKNDLAIDNVLSDKGSYEQIMMDKSDAKNIDTIKWGNQ